MKAITSLTAALIFILLGSPQSFGKASANIALKLQINELEGEINGLAIDFYLVSGHIRLPDPEEPKIGIHGHRVKLPKKSKTDYYYLNISELLSMRGYQRSLTADREAEATLVLKVIPFSHKPLYEAEFHDDDTIRFEIPFQLMDLSDAEAIDFPGPSKFELRPSRSEASNVGFEAFLDVYGWVEGEIYARTTRFVSHGDPGLGPRFVREEKWMQKQSGKQLEVVQINYSAASLEGLRGL